MSDSENFLLAKCLEFTRSLLEKNEKFSFQVHTGSGFDFNFTNQDYGNPESKMKRKKSPNQIKRNRIRMEKFIDQKKKATGKPEAVRDEENVAEYELKIEANGKCTDEDIHEALVVNFQGNLDDLKVRKGDPIRRFETKKLEERQVIKKIDNEFRNLQTFRVLINKHEAAKNIIETWKLRHNFDDLAFKNKERDITTVKVRDVQRVT